jgi:hypothetical protein
MAVSAINLIKELTRQQVNQDENFLKRMLYYFELQLPFQSATGAVVPGLTNSFMFPLILPPESFTQEEPFAVEVTPTQRGGLYAEETGIIQRNIRIRGNTGFKPRKLNTYGAYGTAGSPPTPSNAVPFAYPETTSHARELPLVAVREISGHRHFQYLQDSVFRIYADLKRDPATAESTTMYFHNPKDDEHWKVIPQRFVLDRDKERPHLYNYSIDLLVVDKANATADLDFDDKSILDTFNNAVYLASLGLDIVSGAANDLTALSNDIGTQFNNINVLLDGLNNITTSTQEFVDGVEPLINESYASVQSLLDLADGLASDSSDTDQPETVPIPSSATNMIRRSIEGLELIASNPASFETSNNTTMSDLRNRQELRRSTTQQQRNEVLDGTSPSSFSELEELGTGLTPGEVTSSGGDILAGGDIIQYRNVQEVEIGQGDTLATLASQYLGDARLWQYIAIANGLKPPYVDDQASVPLATGGADELPFGQSLGIGSKILIPSNDAAPSDYPLLPVVGTQLEEPVENQLLGIDALLESDNRGVVGDSNSLYDIAVDTELGSTDVKLATGVSNISQVIYMRLVSEHGSDLLYKQVGLKRIVGLNFTLADLANARYRIRESVGADARISSVRNMLFQQEDDALNATMDAVLRGFTESKPIQVVL